jgi:hypothetical protein
MTLEPVHHRRAALSLEPELLNALMVLGGRPTPPGS